MDGIVFILAIEGPERLKSSYYAKILNVGRYFSPSFEMLLIFFVYFFITSILL